MCVIFCENLLNFRKVEKQSDDVKRKEKKNVCEFENRPQCRDTANRFKAKNKQLTT